jgi:hypothetical protein
MPTMGLKGGFQIPKPRPTGRHPFITASQAVATTGVVLTVDTGLWVGPRTTAAVVQWFRGTASIPSATNATYAVTNSDTGGTALTAQVSMTNPYGTWASRTARITIA